MAHQQNNGAKKILSIHPKMEKRFTKMKQIPAKAYIYIMAK